MFTSLPSGLDVHFGKKTYLNTYYSLSAAKGNVNSFPFGDPTITTGPDKFLLTGTNAAVNYPETTSRNHEVVAVFKYKLTKNLTPKIEYRYQQFDYQRLSDFGHDSLHGLREPAAAERAGAGLHQSADRYAQPVLSVLCGGRHQCGALLVPGRRSAVVPRALSRGDAGVPFLKS